MATYTTTDQLLKNAVPGPYHAVKDERGHWHVSGAVDRVWTDEATVRAAVDALNKIAGHDD